MTDQPTPARDEAARNDPRPGQTPPSGGDYPAAPEPDAAPDYGPPYGEPAQPYAGAYGQPYAGQSYAGQPYSGQPYSGQPYAGAYGQPSGSYSAYGQPAYYVMPQEPKALSITSLCCGIAVFLGFGFIILPQIAAVVLGHLALTREPAGRGMAIAGLVLGYIGIALTALVLLLFAVAVGTFRGAGPTI